MTYNIFFLSILFSLVILSCKKEDVKSVEPPTKYGNMLLKFDNRIGIEELTLNGVTYQNQQGDKFTLSQVNYYISNVVLTKKDDSKVIITKDSCQFLMREDDFFQQWFLLKNIPEGSYRGISFSIGVEKPNLQNPIFDKNSKGKELFIEKENAYAAFFIKGKTIAKDSFEHKVSSPKSLSLISLQFGEYTAEVKENAKNYSTSAHIFCDLSKFLNNTPTTLSEQQKLVETLFQVNHVENK
jgi:hypothetical protein